ncbi:hypothetical protein [Flavobacterium sp. YO12]|uniref:hypothetical protein n=1 Tax=Flavobacterium sp. YO12 TaxID=1920029 RepID=UPI00100B5C14|nr:hypothetical protein [Flavobacterium sp. YO12]RXM48058.1 hypothetical protein BOW55_07695 [Flavobacterium sp. YO12]
MMNSKYPLEWLDRLILEYLNPNVADLSLLAEAELKAISEHVVKESVRIQVRIKNEIFGLRRKRQIRLLVRKYHSTLIFLLDAMTDSQKADAFKETALLKCGEMIIRCLDELLSFLEQQYSCYLNLDERMPVTYFLVSRKELQLKLKSLWKIRSESEEVQQVLKIVVDELADSISLQERRRVTFRQVLYERKLLNELVLIESLEMKEGFSMLDQKLISLNFNSPVYVKVLASRFISRLELEESFSEKLRFLSYYLKELNQIHSSEKLFFNSGFEPVKIVLDNWFRRELEYLEKQMKLSGDSNSKVWIAEKQENKLECDLSADQIGIILRAADETRVVKSRSMSLVFQRIVPHLSTAFKKDLSYQSVRSKSYNAEENDKNIAILALEKMIKKIRTY